MTRICTLLPLLVVSCTQTVRPPAAPRGVPEPVVVTVRSRFIMSTNVTITVAAPRSEQVNDAIEAAFVEVERLEAILSEWKDDSQVARVNAAAGKAPVKVDEEVFAVIGAAHAISEQSGGAFDVTVGALWGAWDFSWEDRKVPTDEELAGRVKYIDYRKVTLDHAARTVFLEEEGMKLTLGGIAKGYAVDRASAVLEHRGYSNHLVVAGGDLYASGRKGGKRWRAGVRDPRGSGLHSVIELENEALATSGNYERYFIEDGVRYHHILDPKTGRPTRGTASATVLAKSATLADGWSTGMFVLGPEKAVARAAELPGVEVLMFAEGTFETSGTEGLLGRLHVAE